MKKTVLLIIVAVILSACGVAPQATPTAIPPTASFTPSPTNTPEPTATLTPTPTPIPKIGTVYLDSEYDLNDRVKIIEANQEVLWKYTTESLMMFNSFTKSGKRKGSYMQKLAESVGVDFNDKAALLEYLKSNKIPTEIDGVEFMYSMRGYNEGILELGFLKKQEQFLDLSHFPVQIISFEDYPSWKAGNQDTGSKSACVTFFDQTYEIMGGLLPYNKGDHIEFVYMLANINRGNTTSFLGFPNPNEPVTSSQSEKLNAYLGGFLYVLRMWVEDEASPLHNTDRLWGLVTFPDNSGTPWIVGTYNYFKTVRQNKDKILDFPPDFIEPR